MSFTCISKDPEFLDLEHPAGCLELAIPSERFQAFQHNVHPAGKKAHILQFYFSMASLETNVTLTWPRYSAVPGFNVMVFHYRGSWGSEGNYSFQNVLEDTRTVIQHLQEPANRERYSVDPSRFILMGHSVGGFSALMNGYRLSEINRIVAIAPYNLGAVARNRRISKEYAELTHEMFVDCSQPLKGTDHETLLEEIDRNSEDWDFSNHASGFRDKDLLVIAGARDDISHPEIHHYPFMKALREANVTTVTDAILNEGHSFHCRRIELAETILSWLKEKKFLPK